MAWTIGKIKVERTRLASQDEQVDAPIIVTDGVLDTSKYDDITSIENWYLHSDAICCDYLQMRERVRTILDATGWSGLTSTEKDIIIELYMQETTKDDATANGEKVAQLMGKGYSLQEAQGILLKSYASHHLKEVDSCLKRANSEGLYTVIAKYLILDDAGDLIKITHKLFDLYKTQAIKGINDGNAGEGLFDFLESTSGTTYETAGLEQQGYTLNVGDYTSFITELMDVLRNGNY
jgi:hypothetical protein